jgi:hypothetical protein
MDKNYLLPIYSSNLVPICMQWWPIYRPFHSELLHRQADSLDCAKMKH